MQKSLREKLQKQALNAKAEEVYWIEHNKGKVQLVGHLINHFTLFCLTELLTCLAHVGDNMRNLEKSMKTQIMNVKVIYAETKR